MGVLSALDRKDYPSARQTLDSIRHSAVVPPETISTLRELLHSAEPTGTMRPLDLPADYLRREPGAPIGLPPLRRLYATRTLLKNSPYELVLPPITCNANDFSFLADVLDRPELAGPVPPLKLRLVTVLNDADDLAALRDGLAARLPDLAHLAGVSLCVFAAPELPEVALPLAADWHRGAPWRDARTTQIARIAADADVVLFLPPAALADPFLAERAVRQVAQSSHVCLMLHWLAPHGAAGDEATPGILANRDIQAPWRGKPAAFRQIDSLAFAVSAAQFRNLGGFDPRFETAFFACREFAFRLYNAGCYFLPLALRGTAPPAPKVPDSPADKALLTALSPHPWDRKTDARHEVPKVSIYIPAYRARRYLRDAIDSVLSQDFQDLEICVADDGSPDSTRAVLESYGNEPRLKWATGPNGGIGHASNRAIRMTRGIYIGQLDSDDRLKPGAIRRLAQYLDENPWVGCAYGSCERIDAAGNYLHKEYSFPEFSRDKMMLTSIAHHFRMFRRQAWQRTEGFREDIVNGVDYDIFLKMSEVTEFRHIDEVLYQRRWHGENTSHVNEAFQTQNTYRVQRDALQRMGLDRYWDVHLPDPAHPRDITYRRKGAGRRVIFWPDYSAANPYQRLLYRDAQRSGEVLGGDINAALRAIREVTPGQSARVTFHLHWLNKVFENTATLGAASDAARVFLDRLREFRFCGGRLVWTIHNTVSHDLPFPQVERALAREIIALADAVHVHCRDSLPEIAAHFDIPPEKLAVHRHGAYLGVYPDFADRARARTELGLDPDDEVMLFLGQIRPYKGIDALVEAFRAIAPGRPRLKLVLAGSGQVEGLLAGLPPDLRARVRLFNRFIDDMELHLFMHAADFTVLPYRNILTSGSLLLALGFGVPAIVPAYGMTRAVLGAGLDDAAGGILYAAEGGTEDLTRAVRRMLRRLDAGQGAAMAAAARACAEAQPWEDISPMLFGEDL